MKRPIHLLMGHQFFHNHGKILSVTKCGRVVTSGRIKYTTRTENVTCGKCCGNVEKKIVVTNNPQGIDYLEGIIKKVSEKELFVSKFTSGVNQPESNLVNSLQDAFNLRDDATEPDPDETNSF